MRIRPFFGVSRNREDGRIAIRQLKRKTITVPAVRIVPFALVLAAVTAVTACAAAHRPGVTDGTLAVVATTPEVADFVRQVGGAAVSVTQIIQPNVDPHEYEPTPADIAAIGRATLVVKNGVGLEKWLDRTISSSGFHGTVVDSSTGVNVRPGDPGNPEMAEGDPHIWHDPWNAEIMVRTIEAGLAAADPSHRTDFATRLAAYDARLGRLDRANEKAFATLPVGDRKLVTNHDAFGYYVDRYHLQFVGSVIPSVDTSAELSTRQVTDLVAKIKATGTKAIFTESSLPPKTADAVARLAGVKVIGGEDALFGDSLGPAGTPGDTYLGAEEHNTEVIVGALGGSA
jgi:zinc/manganese transport system substrate-binding protein